MKYLLALLFFLTMLSSVISQTQSDLHLFLKSRQSKAAFYFIKDSIEFGLNENKLMPTASLSKTIIAIEFMYQVRDGHLDPNDLVSLDEIEKFAIGDDNYRKWKKQIKKEKCVKNKKVSIKYIVQGMIRFSANPCADYMLSRLGIDRVNERIKELPIEHEDIFPFTASLLVAFNYDGVDKKEFLSAATIWTKEEYVSRVLHLHKRILEEKDFLKSIKKWRRLSHYKDSDYDAIWSNKFSLSTAKNYALLIKRLNEGLDPKIDYLSRFIFESWTIQDQSDIGTLISALAYKSANSNSLINIWLYLRTKNQKKVQFVAFFNHLTKKEYKLIEKEISSFAFNLATNEEFLDTWRYSY